MQKQRFHMDPRAGLTLLLAANVIGFSDHGFMIEFGWLIFIGILMVLCGRSISGMKWLFSFMLLLGFQQYVIPLLPKFLATSLVIFANYARKVYSCMMVGSLMIHTISLREMIVAMRLIHVPQNLIVPIAVTLRYFPAIREETGHILDAMKLRNVTGLDRVEALVVPLMISASATAEELSAAAVTRGIENPAKKTSLVKLKMHIIDWAIVCLAAAFSVPAVVL